MTTITDLYIFLLQRNTVKAAYKASCPHRHHKNGSYIQATLVSKQILLSALQLVSEKLTLLVLAKQL